MDAAQIIQLLTGAPMTAIVLYLLIKEQTAHAETRKARDNDWREWMTRYAGLAERVASAVERLDLPVGRPYTD